MGKEDSARDLTPTCKVETRPVTPDDPDLREIEDVPARKRLAVQKRRALETRLRPARERLAVKHLGSYVSGESERSSEEEIRREEYESARD